MNAITPPLNGITATATTTTSTVALPPIEAGSTQYPMWVRIAASAPVAIRIYGDATSNSMLIGPGDATMVKTYGCSVVSMQALSGTARVNIQAIPDAFWLQSLFSPATLFSSGEQGAWYDPSDFSVLFQDSAGTTPVTALGQPVGRMLDKSGRGNHAVQPTAINRPVLQQDASGKYCLAFNGTNSFMQTGPIDFTATATDKMTVVAGVRKLNDAATGFLLETSSDATSNNGAFAIRAPTAGGAGAYGVALRGTGAGELLSTPGSFVAPITNVLTYLADTAQTTMAAQAVLRVNAVQQMLSAQIAGPTSAGNFGIYPLYIGARFGSSFFFNGNVYSLIVRGAFSSPAQITSLETYTNSKTGAY